MATRRMCKECGATPSIILDDKYCKSCGSLLVEDNTPVCVCENMDCPRHKEGFEYSIHYRYCGECGSLLAQRERSNKGG